MSFEFDGMHFDEGFRADLMVEDVVIVELKSVEEGTAKNAKERKPRLRRSRRRGGGS